MGEDQRIAAELAVLAAMDEAEIDTSDIVERDKSFWSNAERGRFYKPVKQSKTVRIDADVLHWLRAVGRGYQTRINAILREAMIRDGAKG
ncbi:BrnA antitoxin family protein [soil metagenome]